MPYKAEYEWSLRNPARPESRRFLQSAALHGASAQLETEKMLKASALAVGSIIKQEAAMQSSTQVELEIVRTIEVATKAGTLWEKEKEVITMIRAHVDQEKQPALDLIRRMLEAIRLFNGHDSSTNLRARYGESWWEAIEAMSIEAARMAK